MSTIYLSLPDLREAGIVSNWTQLSRLIKNYNFPPGFLITPNSRRWPKDEVAQWVEVRRAQSVEGHRLFGTLNAEGVAS